MFFYVFFLAASERVPLRDMRAGPASFFPQTVHIGANCRSKKSNQREKVVDSTQLKDLKRLNIRACLLGRVHETRRRSGHFSSAYSEESQEADKELIYVGIKATREVPLMSRVRRPSASSCWAYPTALDCRNQMR
jgi:hypothetical protein